MRQTFESNQINQPIIPTHTNDTGRFSLFIFMDQDLRSSDVCSSRVAKKEKQACS